MAVLDSPQENSATAPEAAADHLAQHCPWAGLDAVLLVVGELVANAVRHTSGWWRLTLLAGLEELVAEIDDSSDQPPVAREPDFSGGGGFGRHMVHRLAGRVEASPLPEGRRVRAIWPRPAQAYQAQGQGQGQGCAPGGPPGKPGPARPGRNCRRGGPRRGRKRDATSPAGLAAPVLGRAPHAAAHTLPAHCLTWASTESGPKIS